MNLDFKIPDNSMRERLGHRLSDNCASSITADIGCLCPHLDAYLPKFLDTQGLGLCSDYIGSQTLNHPSKRIRRSTISSLHLTSIMGPSCNNTKAKSGKLFDLKKSTPASKGIKYMLGEQERNLDLYLSGVMGYTPLLPSTFIEKVIDERTFEAKATKIFDKAQEKHVCIEKMDVLNQRKMYLQKMTGEDQLESTPKLQCNSNEQLSTDGDKSMPVIHQSEDNFRHAMEIQEKIQSLRQKIVGENQVGAKLKSITPIPSRYQEAVEEDEVTNKTHIIESQQQRQTDLDLANKRVARWLEIIKQNRSKYWSGNKLENGCSFSCKICLKGALKKGGTKYETLPSGDALFQCLDCGLTACGVDFLECQNTKRHMQQHFLYSGHSLGITCGSKGEIFCMKCGDFVYNEVFDREKERINIGFHLPMYAWGRNLPLLRSFCFGDILEDFVIIPEEIHNPPKEKSPSNKIVWRGLRAFYPSEVPEEFIQAARCTLKRFKLFHQFCTESAPQERGNRPKVYFDKPIGVINSGNLCYMTSVLQCLFNLPPVQNYFLRDVRHHTESCLLVRRINQHPIGSSNKENRCNSLCLACEFDKLLLSYHGRCVGNDISKVISSRIPEAAPSREISRQDSLSIERGLPLTASDFIVATWKTEEMRHLAGHFQHDAHEFLQALLDKLNEDCKRMEQTIMSTKKKSNISKFISECKANDDSFEVKTVSSSFQGLLKSVLLCQKCGNKRSQNEPFVNISLPINQKAAHHENNYHESVNRQLAPKRIDIRNCLDHFTEKESLSDPLRCDCCRERTSMFKQQTFSKLPTILCLHLKRFDAVMNKKIDDPISFPPILDMGSYLPHWREVEQASILNKTDTDVCNNTKPQVLYDLCGTINHSGTMNQGHYDASVKIENTWYNCNDAHIRVLSSVDDVLTNNEVYMLFYTRRNVNLS